MNTRKDAMGQVAHAAKGPRERRYETHVLSDCDDVTTARFMLSETDAHEIFRLSALVAANGLHVVRKFDDRTSWMEGDADALTEARSDADTLNVSESEFWFSANHKHNHSSLLTEHQSISELKEWLGVQDVVKNADEAASTLDVNSQQVSHECIGTLWWHADDMAEAKQWESKYLANGAISVELKPEDDRSVVNVIITLDRNRAKEILGHAVGEEEWLDISGDVENVFPREGR